MTLRGTASGVDGRSTTEGGEDGGGAACVTGGCGGEEGAGRAAGVACGGGGDGTSRSTGAGVGGAGVGGVDVRGDAAAATPIVVAAVGAGEDAQMESSLARISATEGDEATDSNTVVDVD